MKQFDEWYAKECENLDPDFVGWTGEAMRDAFRAGMLAVADIVPNNYTQAEWKQVIEKSLSINVSLTKGTKSYEEIK